MNNNRQIVKDTITTTSVNYGLLNPEQASKFLRQTFDATTLRPLIRHEIRTANTGEIDKIGIASRLVRSKVENTDDGHRVKPNYGQLLYATTAVRLPWEITEETLRQNIEGENFESIVTGLMTTQLGLDMEDLELNGNASATGAAAFDTTKAYTVGNFCTYNDGLYEFITAHPAGAWNAAHAVKVGDAADADFLKVNDGWIKQLDAGSHILDRSAVNNGAMSLGVFYDAIKTLPNKYNNGSLRWIMSPHRHQEWIYNILNSAVSNGGIITDGRIENPAAIPVVECASMPDDKIILTNPKNLIEVTTYGVKIRKTIEGKEAIMQDKRFYVVHLDFDPIIEELDAAVLIKGLAAL